MWWPLSGVLPVLVLGIKKRKAVDDFSSDHLANANLFSLYVSLVFLSIGPWSLSCLIIADTFMSTEKCFLLSDGSWSQKQRDRKEKNEILRVCWWIFPPNVLLWVGCSLNSSHVYLTSAARAVIHRLYIFDIFMMSESERMWTDRV